MSTPATSATPSAVMWGVRHRAQDGQALSCHVDTALTKEVSRLRAMIPDYINICTNPRMPVGDGLSRGRRTRYVVSRWGHHDSLN